MKKVSKSVIRAILHAYNKADGGQASAIEVADNNNVPLEYCKGCETEMPADDHVCIICGQSTKTTTIDISMNWKYAMNIHLAVLENGNAEGKKISRKELMDLAGELDKSLLASQINKEMLEAIESLFKSHSMLYARLGAKQKSELIDYEKFPSVIRTKAVIAKAEKGGTNE